MIWLQQDKRIEAWEVEILAGKKKSIDQQTLYVLMLH